MTAIKNGFGSLLRFSGRDRPGLFWPYAAVVFVVMMVVAMATMVPIVSSSFSRMERFAAEHPELATVEQSAGGTSITIQGDHPELIPDFGAFFLVLDGLAIGMVALLAAAVARRLHDTGRSALWGLMPVPFLAIGLIGFPQVMEGLMGPDPNMGLFLGLFLNNLLYMAAFITLVILLILPGKAGANRFGEPPAR